MAMKPIPDADTLRQLLSYDPETGEFRWKERTPAMFKNGAKYRPESLCKRWNTAHSGKIANTVSVKGYAIVIIWKQRLFAHRVIWKMMTGADPCGEVDHINGTRTDNRWVNLRDVPRVVNARNQRRHSRNKSGITGVRFREEMGKWTANIRYNNRQIYLGCYTTKEEAAAARAGAERALGYHPNHGRRA